MFDRIRRLFAQPKGDEWFVWCRICKRKEERDQPRKQGHTRWYVCTRCQDAINEMGDRYDVEEALSRG